MEAIFQSIILGIVQGLGEFLPVSSTAHLVLVPYFFHWEDPGLAFDVALHMGTLIALLAFFWKDWIKILKLATRNSQPDNEYNSNLLWLLIIATIPGVLAGYFLEEKAETVFRNPLLIAFTLAFFGLVLYLADKYAQRKKDIGTVSLKDSIIIGLSQAIAIIPGVSRSGITITAGLFQKLDRVSAARFSFLLSTPIIFGASVLKLPHLFNEGINVPILIGILASAISGYLAIKYLLKFVQHAGYQVFFWYRLGLAILIAVFYILV